ncbi:MAG: CDP-glycerol glycerophosphotransferase family protein [Bacteroidia bacterium]|nr:CDP-glycerol glycerophosphotransferase family protein [Bacteroidia bacterium]
MKHYLLFASHSYSYDIMRPIQNAIRKRGGMAAWYLEDSCPDRLLTDEVRLYTYDEVFNFNPIACIIPGNVVYDFFPGVKVQVFHGYPVRKRGEKIDENFRMRGWFDIYCSPGPSSTEILSALEKKHGYFKSYDTGWCRVDEFFSTPCNATLHTPPTILYAPTFTNRVTSVYVMDKLIDELCQRTNWSWILSFHPLITDKSVISNYETLVTKYPGRVSFNNPNSKIDRFRNTDVMLADSSAIICEYLMFGKLVVTYKNTCPAPHIINCTSLAEIQGAIELALTRPSNILESANSYLREHEYFFDGHNSERVLDAIDDFISNHKGKLKRKPLNLIRRLKLRKRIGYWKNFFSTR